MAKAKSTGFFCRECGYESSKWMGQCPACKAWNTMVEAPSAPASSGTAAGRYAAAASLTAVPGKRVGAQAKPVSLDEIELSDTDRTRTGFAELDRVLGSGVVRGSLVLVGGDPGIGKSTLLLQVCRNLAGQEQKVLYVSGEESLKQIKLRASRIGTVRGPLSFLSETNLDTIAEGIREVRPDVVVIDSIQTIFSSELNSAPGSVSQVRECAARLTRLAKTSGTTLVFVGHVTKEGSLAGPRVLEHIVDTVLYFEGDTHSNFRLIRAFKNRFGAVNELGVFGMTDHGLRGVSNPSAIFLSEYRESVPGSVILVTQEGTRPLLVEIQALVDDSHSPTPKRLSVGLDLQRLSMLLAVLHRHAGVSCFDQDVFVNAVGGMKISEPATDLAVLLAIISSIRNRALPKGLVVFGEIGLAGEVRPAPRGQERLREAAKLGFSRAIIPRANKPKEPIEGLEVIPVDKLSEAVAAVQGME